MPIPNSIWIPAFTDAEKQLARAIVRRMKERGLLREGSADLVVANRRSYGFLELKRPKTRDLFGVVNAAGRPNDNQLRFEDDCRKYSVNHGYSTSWEESLAHMRRWGMID